MEEKKSMFDVSHRSPRPPIRLIGQVICKDVKCPREEPKVAAFLIFAAVLHCSRQRWSKTQRLNILLCGQEEQNVGNISDNDLGIWKSWGIPAVGKNIPKEGGVE